MGAPSPMGIVKREAATPGPAASARVAPLAPWAEAAAPVPAPRFGAAGSDARMFLPLFAVGRLRGGASFARALHATPGPLDLSGALG
ncbi:hypothetical protein [Frateuria defendens]|uniref:hypothetical protein n=1 Tax=Frateuria defendens TaxID=2219559 RepID=UPI00066FBF0C|nr:hypothetical protein [Frateuria defendens]